MAVDNAIARALPPSPIFNENWPSLSCCTKVMTFQVSVYDGRIAAMIRHSFRHIDSHT